MHHPGRIEPKPKRYQCDMCDYKTDCANSFDSHKNKHLGLKPYKCTYENCDFVSFYMIFYVLYDFR